VAEERLRAWETLFGRALEILDSAHRAGSMAREWSFGGGTVLMRRHRHRLSTDICIFVPDPQLLGHLSPRLNPFAEAIVPDYVEQANFLKLYFPQGEIDFVVSGFLTDRPFVVERILRRDVRVETSAEIIAKKVWYRGADFTARDIFDFALVAEREPAAIEQMRAILAARAGAILERMEGWSDALREDFAALDVLDYRPTFDHCAALIGKALAASVRNRTEQPAAQYLVRRRIKSGSDPDFEAKTWIPAFAGMTFPGFF
jgi:hypothetical protein